MRSGDMIDEGGIVDRVPDSLTLRIWARGGLSSSVSLEKVIRNGADISETAPSRSLSF